MACAVELHEVQIRRLCDPVERVVPRQRVRSFVAPDLDGLLLGHLSFSSTTNRWARWTYWPRSVSSSHDVQDCPAARSVACRLRRVRVLHGGVLQIPVEIRMEPGELEDRVPTEGIDLDVAQGADRGRPGGRRCSSGRATSSRSRSTASAASGACASRRDGAGRKHLACHDASRAPVHSGFSGRITAPWILMTRLTALSVIRTAWLTTRGDHEVVMRAAGAGDEFQRVARRNDDGSGRVRGENVERLRGNPFESGISCPGADAQSNRTVAGVRGTPGPMRAARTSTGRRTPPLKSASVVTISASSAVTAPRFNVSPWNVARARAVAAEILFIPPRCRPRGSVMQPRRPSPRGVCLA